MALHRWLERAGAVTGDATARRLTVAAADWPELARDVAASGGRLLALWGTHEPRSAHRVHAVAVVAPEVLVVEVELPPGETTLAGVAGTFPTAGRLQRAMYDMTGLRALDSDVRPWLRHAAWPPEAFPLRDEPMPPPIVAAVDDYGFVRVEGDGVHEIAVGPVHAGIIEPGHFRFSVVGEKVLRLEERLAYVHKGTERRFTELPILEAHRLAARICGDSAVAYSWAYCRALECMAGVDVPARATWLRALALEVERVSNHLGDLGALGNDAGLAFGLSQFMRLKEGWLRAVAGALGQRYLLDFIVPGGTRLDPGEIAVRSLGDYGRAVAVEVQALRDIYEDHSGLRDRFAGAGRLDPKLAEWLGVVGFAGRASGQSLDLRVDLEQPPYGELGLQRFVLQDGDVLARVTVRFEELAESLRLIALMSHALPGGPHLASVAIPAAGTSAAALVEGWRGPVVVALEAGPGGTVRRCHPQDPSWHNWPALEHAIIGNIVPDFPLINKSFNLSYSGHDL